MGLNPDILNALDVLNVHEPTEIQVSMLYLRDETLTESLRLQIAHSLTESLGVSDCCLQLQGTPLHVWK